jgi:thiol-disulfide isomerase/thioredoxin
MEQSKQREQSVVQKQVVTSIPHRNHFLQLLRANEGLIIIKFGATWCGPCKKIKHIVEAFFASSPPNVLCCDIDIDECFDLYSFLKNKRMVEGVPTILCYKRGNHGFIPDDSVVGIEPSDLHSFFLRCGSHLKTLK